MMVCKRCRLPLSDASLEAGNCETCRIHGGVLVTVTECEDCGGEACGGIRLGVCDKCASVETFPC